MRNGCAFHKCTCHVCCLPITPYANGSLSSHVSTFTEKPNRFRGQGLLERQGCDDLRHAVANRVAVVISVVRGFASGLWLWYAMTW